MKRCTRCKAEKPTDAFGACRSEADGLQDWCRQCKRDHYLANRDKVLADCARWRAENADRKKANDRRHYRENREHVLAQAKVYRAANVEKIRAYDRSDARKSAERKRECNVRVARWAKSNKGRRLASSAKRRALKLGVPAAETRALAAFYRHVKTAPRLRCHWCKHVTPKALRHVDHIVPLARGGAHALSNLCCACKACNLSKGGKTPEQFTGMRALL